MLTTLRVRWSRSIAALLTALATAAVAPSTSANPAGACDVSPGEYTAFTGTAAELETASVFSPGVSAARCLKDIRSLGGYVIEGVFKDSKGRYADELPTYGKLMNAWPGEPANSLCNSSYPVGKRNSPSDFCTAASTTYSPKTFVETAAFANALDWKFVNSVRYNPGSRSQCPLTWPPMGCFGDRCYDAACVNADGSLKTCSAGQICEKGACVAGSPASLPTCKPAVNLGAVGTRVENGSSSFYDAWNALVFDLGGIANKVAIFPVNDHGPQPCESVEYTVYLTNNPAAREFIDDPAPTGPDPNKWNRAKIFKIFTHGWIDNPDCCTSPKTCDAAKCALPKPGDNPVLEADGMTLVYSLPCGVGFRYAAIIAGYDGKSLGDPTKFVDRCSYHSYDAEVDAVAGLTDDEMAICPDKDGDGFPTCDCASAPCDCVDDPAVNPDAKKYYPGAPQSCDGPQYSCAPTPCPTGTTCAEGQCLRPCDSGEFKCPGGFTCSSRAPDGGPKVDVCVPAACGASGVCPPGELCKAGTCVDLCAPPTKCPPAQECRGGKCLDPCALVKCPGAQVCMKGKCTLPCSCLKPTAAGYPCNDPTPACNIATSTCVSAGCDTTICPAGKECVGTASGPACKGRCEDVVCPGKQLCDPVKGCADKCELLTTPCAAPLVCNNGLCVEPACANVDCELPFVCRDGKCVEADAGISFDSGEIDTGVAVDSGNEPADTSFGDGGWGVQSPDKEGGCRCSAPGARTTTSLAAFAGLAFVASALMRRRRR